MAREGATVIVISSSSSSDEDEEKVYERSQKLKLRNKFYPWLKYPASESGEGSDDDDDDDDDCVILEKDPFGDGVADAEVAQAAADMVGKLSLSSRGGGGTFSQPQQDQNGEGEEECEVLILAERGKVALRDYPHARHLCANHPFSKTPHEDYCDQCYCYVCDKPAPCEKWKMKPQGHCNATDEDDWWKKLRRANRSGPACQKVSS